MTTTTAAGAAEAPTIDDEYRAYGAAAKLFRSKRSEVVLSGAAGTGKTRSLLEYGNYIATEWPGARILLVRKTRRSLTETAMVTLEQKVLHPAQGVRWEASKQRYSYPNASIIAVAGLDKPSKVMSSEWDLILVPEATELTEGEWEALTTRLRNGKTPLQQIVGDCNPDAPHHWLKQRAQLGKVLMLDSRHEDNPTVTADYLAKLDELTGVRYLRLRLGIWAAAEGMVYQDAYLVTDDERSNLRPRSSICRHGKHTSLYGDCGIDRTWSRHLSIDWGYTAPFVCRWYAEDGDGRLWMYREIYMSHRTVATHGAEMLRYMGYELKYGRPVATREDADPLPRVGVYDPADPQAAQTLMSATGLSLLPAVKDIPNGIQKVRERFQPAGDGLPRLIYLRDSLVERDLQLVEAKKPTCGAEEVESYVWDTRGGRKKGEEPVDANNHAMDCDRMLVTFFDLVPQEVTYGPKLF